MTNDHGPREHALPHGLRLVVDSRPHVDVVAFAVTVGTGSRADPDGRSGLAHMVEHLMFRHTTVAADHARCVERVGGMTNAATYHDHTAYHDLVPTDVLAQVVGFEGRRFTRHDIDDAAVGAERGVIATEITAALAGPGRGFPWTATTRHMFGAPGEANPALGVVEQLADLGAAECSALISDRYTADNIVITAVGGIREGSFPDDVAAAFAGLRSGDDVSPPPSSSATEVDVRARLDGPPGSLPTVAVGVPLPDPRRERAEYLAHVLLGRILTTQLLPSVVGRHPDVLGAVFHVGHHGRRMYRRSPDLALCQVVGTRDAAVDDLEQVLDQALDEVVVRGIPDRARRRAVNELALEHHHEWDDPLSAALALGRASVLGFGWTSVVTLPDELGGLAEDSLRAAATRIMEAPRTVLTRRAGCPG